MASSRVIYVLSILLAISCACYVEGLQSNYYRKSCPLGEALVRGIVADLVRNNKELGANFIRLFFHDCFVEGCDASVLINDGSGQDEIDSVPNQTLHSLNIIDEIKAELDQFCDNKVSCADIIAFTAAESLFSLGGPYVDVLGGRLDGFVSSITEANANIPSPFSSLTQLVPLFQSKGLNNIDLVALSGAHTVGVGHCGTFSNRIRNFNATYNIDPTLNAAYATNVLQPACPVNPPSTATAAMDPLSPNQFDNKYFLDLLLNEGLFTSDASLLDNAGTKAAVQLYARNPLAFFFQFGVSLVKMGQIDLKTPANGNIRKVCSSLSG